MFLLQWPIYVISSVDKTKLVCYISLHILIGERPFSRACQFCSSTRFHLTNHILRHMENNEIESLPSYDKDDFPPDLENLHA